MQRKIVVMREHTDTERRAGFVARPASSLRAYIELFHLPPILMVLLATTAFATIAADGLPRASRLAPYLLAVLATQMAISVHNDYCDRRLDAQAKPWRAIPSGLISPQFALELAAVLTVAGLALALPLGARVVGLGAIGTGAGFAYNARLKGTAFAWVPFWVALPAMAIASFELVHEYREQLLLVYLIGLPLVVSVYIADQLIDIESDRMHGVHGLVASLGQTRARLVCWGALASGNVLAVATVAVCWVAGSAVRAFVGAVGRGDPRRSVARGARALAGDHAGRNRAGSRLAERLAVCQLADGGNVSGELSQAFRQRQGRSPGVRRQDAGRAE